MILLTLQNLEFCCSLEHHLPDLYLLTHYCLYANSIRTISVWDFALPSRCPLNQTGEQVSAWRATSAALARC